MTHILTNSALERALKDVDENTYSNPLPAPNLNGLIKSTEAKRIIRELVEGMGKPTEAEKVERIADSLRKGLTPKGYTWM